MLACMIRAWKQWHIFVTENMATPKSEGDLLTLELMKSAAKVIEESKHCRNTPLLCHMAQVFGIDDSVDLYMKLESMQVTGA